MDYPVGSFLLWTSAEYQQAQTAQGTGASLWIVDGQQRITALCLLVGVKPYWWPEAQDWNKTLARYDVLVNLLPQHEAYLEFGLPNPIRRQDPRWVSVRAILSESQIAPLTPLAQRIVNGLTQDPDQRLQLFPQIHSRVLEIWQIRGRQIPIVKISHEVEDVAEIFARLNRQGTRVKEADVVLSLAAVRNPGWVREKYLPYRNDLEDRGWDLDAGIFVRTMSGIGHGRVRLSEVPRDFWNTHNLPKAWKRTQEAISQTVKRLAEYGILCADLLPSTNSLIPLFVFHSRWANAPEYDFRRVLYWFLMANRDGRYSASPITSLSEDVRAIHDAEGPGGALQDLMGRLRISTTLDEEEFLGRYDKAGSLFLRLMLYLLLFQRGARDWVDRCRLGYDTTGAPLTTGFQPQWHHIFPRKVLRKAGYSDDQIHALSNITVLTERTNVNRLSGKEPGRYIQDYAIPAEVLEEHVMPPRFANAAASSHGVASTWDVAAYQDFILERAILLAQEANAFLCQLRDSRATS